ncbi:MAG: glycosyltransferase family 2 protein [Caulobacteraceae bacterium]
MKVLIALPAYNEEHGIASVLSSIINLREQSKYDIRVLVVNDGSTDETANIVQGMAYGRDYINLINHDVNKGLGKAVNTILLYAIENLNNDDILITLDADNTHSPYLIENMIDHMMRNNLDLVVASRFTDGGREIGLSNIRKLYSRGAMYYFKLFFPIKNLNDYSSGYRAYNMGILREAYEKWNGLVTTSGFECMAEIAAKFSKMKIKAGEIPLVLRYDYKNGKSKMKVASTIKGYFSLLSKVR